MSRPRVVVHNIASADGRLTLAPDVLLLGGDERWRAVDDGNSSVGDWLRAHHAPEVMLEGSGSFVLEGAEPEPLPPFDGDPAPLYEDYLPGAIIGRAGHRGWFCAVDGRGRVRWEVKDGAAFGPAWVGWYALSIVHQATPPAYLAYLQREEIPYLVAGPGPQVDLATALEKLGGKLGVACVLSTAGGRLNGALLRAGLVDEINIEFCPAIIGGIGTPALFDAPPLQAGDWPTRLRLLSAEVRDGGRVWLRYAVEQAPVRE